ncbi:hypothetical protein OU995_20500 [Roseateles sp. SL47]|uniref:type IV pilus assembly protein FimV n=1 Tax=Roseateles sp. SL47 TaxID=2995138 RepID=UPI00227037A4|nr:hypothetical protein [Roseateles sp. SL47]WAC71936.1 hypothetical protein OU995_20500 [Roseateles sp. SL47]
MLASLAMMSTSAWGLGVGRPQTASSLGQPLNLFFPVQLAPGDVVTADCIRAEVTAGETILQPSSLRWQLETDGQQQLRGVRLRSSQAINEPLVAVSLTLGCSAAFTRQYTAFIDPPGHSVEPLADPGTQGAVSTPVFQVATGGEPRQPAPRDASAARTRAAAVPFVEAASAASAAAAAASAPARSRRQPVRRTADGGASSVSARGPAGPRLSMEPAEVLLPPNAARLASEAAEAASAASAVAEARAQLAVMEKRVADLQAEQRRTNEVLQSLREELKAAREQRADDKGYPTWMLALTLLSLGLAASSLLLWRSRKPQRKEAQQSWWGDPQADTGAALDLGAARVTYPSAHPAAAAEGVAPTQTAPGAAAAALVALDRKDLGAATATPTTMPMPLSITDPERTMQLPPRAAPSPAAEPAVGAPSPAGSSTSGLGGLGGRGSATAAVEDALDALASLDAMEPLRFEMRPPPGDTRPSPLLRDLNGLGAVTVEELIDLEQQVDFFLVLGQDDAAIELLSSRLGERDAASGLPYLKLLELYQRRGDKTSFERVGQRFSQQFRARPPAWSADLNEGVGLEAHTELVERLQSAWVDPSGSMSLLQDLFSHHQEYSGELGLPAYRDLLLLYAVARDRAEHEVRSQDIDVFLPLDATAPPDMMATMAWQTPTSAPGAGGRTQRPGVGQSLDVDLDLSLANEDEPPKKPKAY